MFLSSLKAAKVQILNPTIGLDKNTTTTATPDDIKLLQYEKNSFQ